MATLFKASWLTAKQLIPESQTSENRGYFEVNNGEFDSLKEDEWERRSVDRGSGDRGTFRKGQRRLFSERALGR